MKRCPTCNRTFENTLTFCLSDGAILSAPFDPQATQVIAGSEQPESNGAKSSSLPSTVASQPLPPTIAAPPHPPASAGRPSPTPSLPSTITSNPVLQRMPAPQRPDQYSQTRQSGSSSAKTMLVVLIGLVAGAIVGGISSAIFGTLVKGDVDIISLFGLIGGAILGGLIGLLTRLAR